MLWTELHCSDLPVSRAHKKEFAWIKSSSCILFEALLFRGGIIKRLLLALWVYSSANSEYVEIISIYVKSSTSIFPSGLSVFNWRVCRQESVHWLGFQDHSVQLLWALRAMRMVVWLRLVKRALGFGRLYWFVLTAGNLVVQDLYHMWWHLQVKGSPAKTQWSLDQM